MQASLLEDKNTSHYSPYSFRSFFIIKCAQSRFARGSSSHFKEKILTEVGKPVDPHYFCFTLGALQIICLLLLSPLFFPFQNIGSGETSNPYMEKVSERSELAL